MLIVNESSVLKIKLLLHNFDREVVLEDSDF